MRIGRKEDSNPEPEQPGREGGPPQQQARPAPGRRHARDADAEVGRPGHAALDARYDAPWYDDTRRVDPRYEAYPAAADDPYAVDAKADAKTWRPGRRSRPDRRQEQQEPREPREPREPQQQRQETEAAAARREAGSASGPERGAQAASPWPPGWDPIIVELPTAEFEPKPPVGGYQPDTEFDGWSTDHITVRLASVRGYSHRWYGQPRQDHVSARVHKRTGTVLFAVADGVSSAQQAQVGAYFACDSAITVINSQLHQGGDPDWIGVLRTAADRIVAEASRELGRPADPAEAEALFATTLVVGVAKPVPAGLAVSMARIGDSGAWVLEAGEYRPVLGLKNDPAAAVVSSAVHPLPRVPAAAAQARFTLGPGQALLVGTDGFGDPLGDGRGQVGRLFARWLSQPPPARGLAHLLDFSRETFDDDRTLLVLWPRAAAGPGAP
jgi:hypothetical protein